MRIQSSFADAVAAAVVAVVFSAAFQPAEASIITIDKFTTSGTVTASGGSGVAAVTDTALTQTQPGGFGGFNERELATSYGQATTRGTRTVLSRSNGSGTGTLQLTNDGTGTGATPVDFFDSDAYSFFGYIATVGDVNLTGQEYAGFRITTAATSSTPANAFKGFLYLVTTGGSQDALYELPGMWAPNTDTWIPFSTLTAINPSLDFANVSQLYVGIRNTAALPGSTVYSATANFNAIAVPEPSHMVFVAGVGAVLGAWRLRKLRRARPAAGEAIAG